jgi:hypothetical protein
MRLLASILLLLFPLYHSLGQTIAPQTINVGGAITSSSGLSLDYSIVESSSITYYKLSNNSPLIVGVYSSLTIIRYFCTDNKNDI